MATATATTGTRTREKGRIAYLPENVSIEVRRPAFAYDRQWWFAGEPALSHFLEALSMAFPDGEKFFVDSVMRYRDRIEDPVLREQAKAFAGQEGAHRNEHRKYNEIAAGEITAQLEGVAKFMLGIGRKVLDAKSQLAITVALEHYTATMAAELLCTPTYGEAMDPGHRELWLWHAVEETEHKAVAFDVYRSVGGGYFRRAFAMAAASFFLWPAVAYMEARLMKRSGNLLNVRSYATQLKWLFGKPGFARRIVPQLLDFFRPGFHPWDHDNSEFVAAWKAQYGESAGAKAN